MKLTVNDKLYNEAQKKLAKMGTDVEKTVEKEIKKAGTMVAAEARKKAPKDSGEGAKSIRARKETRRRSKYYKATRVGPITDEHQYMLFPEYGSKFQDSQWFVHEALEENEDKILRDIEEELRKVLL